MRVLTPLQRTLTSCVLLLALVTLPYTVVTGTQSDLAPNDVEYDLQRAEDVPADWELAQPDTIDEATALSLLETLSSTSVDLDRTGKKKKKGFLKRAVKAVKKFFGGKKGRRRGVAIGLAAGAAAVGAAALANRGGGGGGGGQAAQQQQAQAQVAGGAAAGGGAAAPKPPPGDVANVLLGALKDNRISREQAAKVAVALGGTALATKVLTASAQTLFANLKAKTRLAQKDRDPPKAGRQVDPEFDFLDYPQKCPQQCNNRGKCMIDRSRLVKTGRVMSHPFRCHCDPNYAGSACQTRVDLYLRWFESNGTTPFPKCCNICPSQFANPSRYLSLPVYHNPFAVSNCDPQLSVDSRPENGRPPCWRPLASIGEPSFAELQSRASARRHAPSGDLDAHPGMRMGQSFLELLAQAGIHPKEVNWGDLLGPPLEEDDSAHDHESATVASSSDDLVASLLERHATAAPPAPPPPPQQKAGPANNKLVITKKVWAPGTDPLEQGMKRAENLKNADWMKAGQQRVAAATAAIGVGLVAKMRSRLQEPPDKSDVMWALQQKAEEKQQADLRSQHEQKLREMYAEEEEKRFNTPMRECCIYCDFDYWAEINTRPPPPRFDGRRMTYLRAMERQRILERVGAIAMLREMQRRERVRQAKEKAFQAQLTALTGDVVEDPYAAAAFLELETALRGQAAVDSEVEAQAEVTADRRRRARPAQRAVSNDKPTAAQLAAKEADKLAAKTDQLPSGEKKTPDDDSITPGGCCHVCPVPVANPRKPNPNRFQVTSFLETGAETEAQVETETEAEAEVESQSGSEYISPRERWRVVTEQNQRFGTFLRRGREMRVSECCEHCDSQFYLRTVSQDSDPFYGTQVKRPKKVSSGPPSSAAQTSSSSSSSSSGT